MKNAFFTFGVLFVSINSFANTIDCRITGLSTNSKAQYAVIVPPLEEESHRFNQEKHGGNVTPIDKVRIQADGKNWNCQTRGQVSVGGSNIARPNKHNLFLKYVQKRNKSFGIQGLINCADADPASGGKAIETLRITCKRNYTESIGSAQSFIEAFQPLCLSGTLIVRNKKTNEEINRLTNSILEGGFDSVSENREGEWHVLRTDSSETAPNFSCSQFEGGKFGESKLICLDLDDDSVYAELEGELKNAKKVRCSGN